MKTQWFPVSVPLQRMTMTLCSASKNLDTMRRGSLQMADLIGAYQDRTTGLRPEFDLILVGGFKNLYSKHIYLITLRFKHDV